MNIEEKIFQTIWPVYRNAYSDRQSINILAMVRFFLGTRFGSLECLKSLSILFDSLRSKKKSLKQTTTSQFSSFVRRTLLLRLPQGPHSVFLQKIVFSLTTDRWNGWWLVDDAAPNNHQLFRNFVGKYLQKWEARLRNQYTFPRCLVTWDVCLPLSILIYFRCRKALHKYRPPGTREPAVFWRVCFGSSCV